MTETIAIMGGFGGGNLGDEFIGLAEARFLDDRGIEPVMYSFDPLLSQHIQPGVRWLDYRGVPDYFQRIRNLVRGNRPREIQEMPRSIVIGAGGMLYDQPITHLLGWHSRTLYFRRRKVPYALFANSLRRPRSRLAAYLLRELLRHASSVSLRDRLSLEIARELWPGREYFLARDPVLALGDVLVPDNEVSAVSGRIAVAPRPWPLLGADEGLSFWAGLLKDMMEQQGLDPVLVAFDPRMDIQFCNRLAEMLRLQEVRSWDVKKGLAGSGALFAGCEMVFGMRFHALILALLLEKPMLAFSYDEKVTGLMSDVGLSSLCLELDGDGVAAREFIQRGRLRVERDRSAILGRMREYVAESRALASEDFARTLASFPSS